MNLIVLTKKNMNRIITTVLVICLISCKKEKQIDEIKLSQKKSDTLKTYYSNGKIKEEGVVKDDLKIGWWSYYDSIGTLMRKDEYKIIYNKPFANQTISYNKKGEIDYDNSWFFNVKLPDTIKLGRNMGEVHYFSTKKADKKYLLVIVDNEYTKGVIKQDTFIKEPNYTWFGVFAHKVGKKKVNFRLVEELLSNKIINKDSATSEYTLHSKYFEKEVYVRDTIQ
jgi:hypothetical protein